MRTCDERVIAGDTTKFKRCSGWKPEIGLNQTISDMVEWWRNHLEPWRVSQGEVREQQHEVSA